MMYNKECKIILTKRKDIKMKKTGLFALMTAGAVMLSTAGCGGANKAAGAAAIEIGDHKITMADVSVLIQTYTTSYGLEFDDAKTRAVEDVENVFEHEALAKKLNIEFTDKDNDAVLMQKSRMVQSSGQTLSEYKEYLNSIGSSIDFIKDYATASVYASKIEEEFMNEESDITATTEEMGEFLKDDYYRAKHILITEPAEEDDTAEAPEADAAADAEATAAPTPEPTPVNEEDGKKGEDLANLILEKAKKGEDFDAMIEKYNTDPGMAQNPDGYVFTDGYMVAEFEDCVKDLKPGEFGIAKTDYGYHVIQRLSLDGSEENFKTWVEDNKSSLIFKALCKKNGIEAKVNQDVVDAYSEKELVTPEPVE